MRLSFFSIRAAQEAQVIPVMSSSIRCNATGNFSLIPAMLSDTPGEYPGL